jgi:hypothetical protein
MYRSLTAHVAVSENMRKVRWIYFPLDFLQLSTEDGDSKPWWFCNTLDTGYGKCESSYVYSGPQSKCQVCLLSVITDQITNSFPTAPPNHPFIRHVIKQFPDWICRLQSIFLKTSHCEPGDRTTVSSITWNLAKVSRDFPSIMVILDFLPFNSSLSFG